MIELVNSDYFYIAAFFWGITWGMFPVFIIKNLQKNPIVISEVGAKLASKVDPNFLYKYKFKNREIEARSKKTLMLVYIASLPLIILVIGSIYEVLRRVW